MTIRRGASRIVLLIGRYAIKFPRLHFGQDSYPSPWSWFFGGMHANSIEVGRWKRDRDHRMARVIFGCALVLVMERCAEVVDLPTEMLGTFEGIINGRDMAPHNFGVSRAGHLVAIDYAFW